MKIILLFIICFLQSWVLTLGQNCILVNQSVINQNPAGLSYYNCVDLNGVVAGGGQISPTNYDILSATSVKIDGESYLFPGLAAASRVIIETSPIEIIQISPYSLSVPKNEKLEFSIGLPELVENRILNFVNDVPNTQKLNPFDPLDVDIKATFKRKDNSNAWITKGYQYGFFYREFSLDTSGQSIDWHRDEILLDDYFRLRYSPQETGEWYVSFLINISNVGIFTTENYYFSVIESSTPGFLKVSSDGRYFERDGEFYYPVGQVHAYPDCVSSYCSDMPFYSQGQFSIEAYDNKFSPVKSYRMYKKILEKVKEGGSNYFRILFNEWGLEIEFEKLGNYYDRMELAWEMDRILEQCHDLDLLITMDMALHTRVETFSVYGMFNWDWEGGGPNSDIPYCYNNIPGVDYPEDMLTNSTAKRFAKNRLRYILSRYGYSPNIGLLEMSSESNNLGQGFNAQYVPAAGGNWSIIDTQSGAIWPDYLNFTSRPKSYEQFPSVVPKNLYKWNNELLKYLKVDLGLNEHLMGVSYAGDANKIELGDSSYHSPYVDYIGFNNGDYKANRFLRFYDDWDSYIKKYRVFQNLNKPLINSEITFSKYTDCDNFSEWYKNMWVPPFTGMALTTSWPYQFHLTFPDHIGLYGNLKTFLSSSDFRNHNGYTWQPLTSTREDRLVDLFCMKGVNQNDKFAEGVILNNTYNFFTQKTFNGNDVCNNATINDLKFLEYIKEGSNTNYNFSIPLTVVYNSEDKLIIPDMGLGKWYWIDWFDPVSGNFIYSDFQISNLFQGFLNIEFPMLTAKINGWQNWSLFDGIRPIMAFKVRPFSEESRFLIQNDSVFYNQMSSSVFLSAENSLNRNADDYQTLSFNISPNPTDGIFFIDIISHESFNYFWTLSDLSGKLIMDGKLDGKRTQMDISAYPSGVYVFSIFGADGVKKLFKIVKL